VHRFYCTILPAASFHQILPAWVTVKIFYWIFCTRFHVLPFFFHSASLPGMPGSVDVHLPFLGLVLSTTCCRPLFCVTCCCVLGTCRSTCRGTVSHRSVSVRFFHGSTACLLPYRFCLCHLPVLFLLGSATCTAAVRTVVLCRSAAFCAPGCLPACYWSLPFLRSDSATVSVLPVFYSFLGRSFSHRFRSFCLRFLWVSFWALSLCRFCCVRIPEHTVLVYRFYYTYFSAFHLRFTVSFSYTLDFVRSAGLLPFSACCTSSLPFISLPALLLRFCGFWVFYLHTWVCLRANMDLKHCVSAPYTTTVSLVFVSCRFHCFWVCISAAVRRFVF